MNNTFIVAIITLVGTVLVAPSWSNAEDRLPKRKIVSVADVFGTTEVPLADESFSTTAQFAPQTSDPDTFSPKWLPKGQILIYNFQGVPEFPPSTYVYSARSTQGSGLRVQIDGNTDHVVDIVCSEFPDGVTTDFISGHLLTLLSRFHSLEVPITEKNKGAIIDEIEPSITEDPKHKGEIIGENAGLKKRLSDFLDLPVVTKTDDNRWRLQYLAINRGKHYSLNFLEGTFKPFRISSRRNYQLSTRGQVGYFTSDLVTEYTTAKERVLKREVAVKEVVGK